MDLRTDLAPRNPRELLLPNPVLTASGSCGYGVEFARLTEVQRLGALVSKGTTLHARRGNPMPRTAETHAGMLNSIGLNNPGLRRRAAPLRLHLGRVARTRDREHQW